MHDRGKSDGRVVPEKPSNNAASAAAEVVEGRRPARGNAASETRSGRRAGVSVSSDLDRVRQVARKDKDVRFTALLHHVTVDRLEAAYRAIRPGAAPGVDGVTWKDYGRDLEANLRGLHARVHRGAYRARPSRRAYIPKPDGRQRPLGVAALEDKILQRAVAEVLNAIYECDFLGFSYGFRPGRSPHHALDALAVGIAKRRVNWLLDADIRDYFSKLDHSWLEKFLEHRIADKRGSPPDPEMAQGGGHRGRDVDGVRSGNAARGVNFDAAFERLPALRLRPMGPPVEEQASARRRDRHSLR
jgi:RNA-directed DNA polymerase